MKRIALSLAVFTLLVSANGCGCCSWMFPKQQVVATPVVTQCAPACDPCNTCDPCCSGGAYNYGAPMAPPATFGAPVVAP